MDPRLSSQSRELVTLVCDCRTRNCAGKFKLQYLGSPAQKWLTAASNVTELSKVLMSLPGIYSENSVFAKSSIEVYNDNSNSSICTNGVLTKNRIKFFRNTGDQPKISFYANLIGAERLYFETSQRLICDCSAYSSCNGTFRLNFDGQMSALLNSASNGSDVLVALNDMDMISNAGYTVSIEEFQSNNVNNYFVSPLMTSLCTPNAVNNMTILFQGSSGNAPRLSIWTSVVKNHNPDVYDSRNRSTIMSVETDDGRDDYVKLCNGLGKCNFATGLCECVAQWGPDPNIGPCGRYAYNTSRDAGPGRCPGLYSNTFLSSSSPVTYDDVPNYSPRVYLSMNPNFPSDYTGPTPVYSAIYYFEYKPQELLGPQIDKDTAVWVLDLTSSTSAGMLCIDNKDTMLYFIDQKENAKFIGKHNMTNPELGNYTRYIELNNLNIFTMTLDVHMSYRRLYYSVPYDTSNSDMGSIYFVLLSEKVSPTIYKLSDYIDQVNISLPTRYLSLSLIL